MANPRSPIAESIELLSREKNIDPEAVITALKEAIRRAYEKQNKTGEDIEVEYDPETGQIEIFARKVVVEQVTDPAREISIEDANQLVEGAEVGDIVEIPRPFEGLGRIAAQMAKQTILQKVREAERQRIYEEYIGRVGELTSGFVKRFEKKGDMIVDLGTVEALLPRSEQSKAERYSVGERIRAVIKEVTRGAGHQVILSRTAPELIVRLFEMEVPEIYDGTVQIKACAREPGERAKIAVASTDPDVDPVGACVGMRGSRVQAVIRELHGEKIDIIEWSENPAKFAASALSPARVNRVHIVDPTTRRLEVIVDDDQLSLAIGKQGQNVRLAVKLVGWHIDIRSESELKREVAAQMEQLVSGGGTPLSALEGRLPESALEQLRVGGLTTLEQIAHSTADQLAEKLNWSLAEATAVIALAQEVVKGQEAAPATSAPVTPEHERA